MVFRALLGGVLISPLLLMAVARALLRIWLPAAGVTTASKVMTAVAPGARPGMTHTYSRPVTAGMIDAPFRVLLPST